MSECMTQEDAERMDDLIRRQDAIDEIEYELEMINTALDSMTLDFNARERLRQRKGEAREILNSIQMLPSAHPEPNWIPIKTRPMDDDEREYYSEHFGYDIEYEEAIMFDCKMPEDDQEVWVCYKNGTVSQDVCENDDGMVGLEGNGDWDGIVAWMPIDRPEPYKGEVEQDG